MAWFQGSSWSYNNQDNVLVIRADTDQWNRTWSPEVDSQIHDQMISNKVAKIHYWGKEQPQQTVLEQLDVNVQINK